MERLPVVLALTPVAERAIEQLLFDRAAPLEPVASVAEADELEPEVAAAGEAVVLVSPDLSGLTAAHCARVRAAGARVVGVALGPEQRQDLLALGVDDVVEPDDSPEAFAGSLRGPARPAQEPAPAPAPRPRPRIDGNEADGGSVVCVIGSKGAPGASECAASLAALASQRWPCVLVELDLLGGGLDLRLGADPRQGSLLGLARAASSRDGAVGELLERWLTARDGWPPVLVGPPEPEQALAELAAPGVVAGALRALAAVYPLAVADVGFLLAEGDEAGPACRAHREALVAADAVVLVLGAREQQLRAGVAQLDALLALDLAPERLRVVVNGLGGPGAVTRDQLETVLLRQLGERRFALDARLPWDGRALARARRTGLPLARARRRGPYARALARLLEELFLPLAPAPRQRKLRLTPPQQTPADARDEEEVALPWRS